VKTLVEVGRLAVGAVWYHPGTGLLLLIRPARAEEDRPESRARIDLRDLVDRTEDLGALVEILDAIAAAKAAHRAALESIASAASPPAKRAARRPAGGSKRGGGAG